MNKHFYSINAGICYNVDASLADQLDEGQLPLKKLPSNSCKKCYDKRYTGFNTQNFTYIPCKCVLKVVDSDGVKQKFNINSPSV